MAGCPLAWVTRTSVLSSPDYRPHGVGGPEEAQQRQLGSGSIKEHHHSPASLLSPSQQHLWSAYCMPSSQWYPHFLLLEAGSGGELGTHSLWEFPFPVLQPLQRLPLH